MLVKTGSKRDAAAAATSLIGVVVLSSMELLEAFGLEISTTQVHAVENWIAVVLLAVSAVMSWRKGGGELPAPGPGVPPLFPNELPPVGSPEPGAGRFGGPAN